MAELEDLFVKDKVTYAEYVHPVLCSDGHTYDLLDLVKHTITRSHYTGATLSICGPDLDRRYWSHHRSEDGSEREKAYKQFVDDMRQAVTTAPRGAIIENIDAQLRQNPYKIKLRLQHAESLLARKQFAEAEQHFAKVLQLAPDAPRALTGRRHSLSGMGDHEEVVAQLDSLLRTTPVTGLLLERGQSYFHLNRYGAAAADLNQVVAKQASCWEAHQMLAWIYRKLNRPTQALYHADNVLALQPHRGLATLVHAAVHIEQRVVPSSRWSELFKLRLQRCLPFLPAKSEQLSDAYALLTKIWLNSAILSQNGPGHATFCADRATTMDNHRAHNLSLEKHRDLHRLASIVWSITHADRVPIQIDNIPVQEAGVSQEAFTNFLRHCCVFRV
jgi:tetratricopeptide (TPR) repeat protein